MRCEGSYKIIDKTKRTFMYYIKGFFLEQIKNDENKITNIKNTLYLVCNVIHYQVSIIF